MTYINVLQGKNIIPRIGQIAELKAEALVSPTHRTGRIIHQRTPAKRGPKNTKTVKKQHMIYPPLFTMKIGLEVMLYVNVLWLVEC